MNRLFALYRLMSKNGYANSYDTTSKFKFLNKLKDFFRKPVAVLGLNVASLVFGLVIVNLLELETKKDFFSALTACLIFVNYLYVIVSCSYIFYLFYLNNDLEKYIVLPVKKMQLLFVKYIHLMSYMYFYVVCSFVPLLLFYLFKIEFSIIPILVLIFGLIFMPFAINSLLCILIFTLVRTFKFLRNKNAITYFMYVVIFGLVLAFQFNFADKILKVIGDVLYANQTFSPFYLLFPFIPLLNGLNNNNFLQVVLFLAINLLYFGLYLVAAYYFYYPYATKLSEQGSKKQKVNYAKIRNKKSSVVKSLLAREFKSVLRNAHCSFQYIFVNFFYLGIIIFILGFSVYKIFQEGYGIDFIINLANNFDIADQFNSMGFDGKIEIFKVAAILACLTAIIQLNGSPNATSFSREGSVGIDNIKTWPIKAFEVFKSKVLLGPLLNIVTFSPVYLIMFIFLGKLRLYVALAYVFFLIASYFTGWYALTINVFFPKFKWENEIKVIKQSLSSTICAFTFIILYFGLIFGITTPIGRGLNMSQILSFVLFVMLLIVLIGVIGMFYCYFNSEKIMKNFNQ